MMAAAVDLKMAVVSQARVDVGTIDLPPVIFTEPLRRGLLADVVHMQTASRRAGSAATKEKGEVRGGGKKPWRQKGTGRARAGSTRSPLWAGGGTIFGPHPRSYSYTLPRKVRRIALRSMLSQKLREGRLTVLDRIEFPATKTKHFVAMLAALQIDDTVLVVVDDETDRRVELAGRNLPRAKVLRVIGLNVYDLLRYHHLVVTTRAIKMIGARAS